MLPENLREKADTSREKNPAGTVRHLEMETRISLSAMAMPVMRNVFSDVP